MDKSKNKKVAIIVIVAILALGAVLIPMLTSGDGDNASQNNQENTGGQMADTPDNDQTDQSQPADDGDDSGAVADDMSTTATLTETVDNIVANGRDLEAELDGIIAAGCGDDLEAFNQRVIAAATSLGSWQESLGGAFADPSAQPDLNLDPNLPDLLIKLEAVSQSIEAKHAQVADLSNTCNSQ